MKKLILAIIFSFVCLSVFMPVGMLQFPFVESVCEAGEKDEIKTIENRLLGEWKIASNKCTKNGKLTFYKNNKYKIFETDNKGTGSGYTGKYKLNTSTDPVTIDLCLGECGGPGSEWTTRFGILRFISDKKMEIRTSPDSNHPKSFSKDKDECYTLMLTKKGKGKI